MSDDAFTSMLNGVLAHPAAAKIDAVLTGYFASAGQVAAAVDAINRLLERDETLLIACDPVMGDAPGGLYVPEAVAVAIADQLIPLSTCALPNAWEAQRLTGKRVRSPEDACAAARALSRPSVISSVERESEIGAVYMDEDGQSWFAHAPKRQNPPHGGGDMLGAAFLAANLNSPYANGGERLAYAVSCVDAALEQAEGQAELSALIRQPQRLVACEAFD